MSPRFVNRGGRTRPPMFGADDRNLAIDLVVTPDGRYVFLEINPNGQFLWVEQLTGLPISRAIAALLIRADRRSVSETRLLEVAR